ncbi:hypothetical protein BDZ90DRAFT_221536 [Jaminaea rosea]|uniref:S-adenosyl-L-methionine-dependent methyltransferase n=1 Tax=Jaminaea rosea TaxID=1569628 RepID=A0A316UQ22_9BASI|nr:hypothetical protein BDZ90DRAFT_221536 [Jaminaea rosea]PWN26888.1 hypothetical protein BDZ90DRAFT_221536 [Jaminaea rosea]
MLVTLMLYHGLIPAIFRQLSFLLHLQPLKFLSPWQFRDGVWGASMPKLLKMSDEAHHDAKKWLLTTAKGKVLEVGAGSGETIKYYDEAAIDHLYALEPFEPAVPHLVRSIAARGKAFERKSTVIAHGIQDDAALARHGIKPGSLDALVLVQCLCSIPGGPEAHLARCVELVKPGGVVLMMEHTAQLHDPIAAGVQRILNPAWRFMANGCEMTRDSLGVLMRLDCWESVEVQRVKGQTASALLPQVYVRATKAGGQRAGKR